MQINKQIDYRNTKFFHLFTVKGKINELAIEGLYDALGDFKFSMGKKKVFYAYPVILKDVKEPGSESAYVYYDERANEDILKQALFEHLLRKYGSLTFMGTTNNENY